MRSVENGLKLNKRNEFEKHFDGGLIGSKSEKESKMTPKFLASASGWIEMQFI